MEAGNFQTSAGRVFSGPMKHSAYCATTFPKSFSPPDLAAVEKPKTGLCALSCATAAQNPPRRETFAERCAARELFLEARENGAGAVRGETKALDGRKSVWRLKRAFKAWLAARAAGGAA